MLSSYGTNNIIIMLAISVVFFIFAIVFKNPWATWSFSILGGLLAAFTFWFFRDPEREVPFEATQSDNIIIAPADGKIVQIVDVFEAKYFNENAKQISIFLSPLDVHVNRIPLSGVVKNFEYIPGKYIIANHPKSSELNEQTHIVVENSSGRVFFKQIVGVVARRLAWSIKEGDTVAIGDRFGMMKFGSRMDVIVHPNSEIFIKVGDRVVAGETIIVKLPEKKTHSVSLE